MRYWLSALVLAGCANPQDARQDTKTTEQARPDGPVFGSWLPDDYVPSNPARLIVFGDSVSRGTGSSSWSLGYPQLIRSNDDTTWPDHTSADLESRFGELTEVHEVAAGGAATSHVVDYQLPTLDEALPDVVEGETLVVGTIGGNDMVLTVFGAEIADDPEAHAQPDVDALTENMHALADFFDDPVRFPDPVYLYVTNIYEPTDTEGQADPCFTGVSATRGIVAIDMANWAMLQVAQERGYGYVDLRSHYLGHGHNAANPDNPWHQADDPTVWFVGDCIHPNDRGHHEIRRLFMAAIDGQPLQPPE